MKQLTLKQFDLLCEVYEAYPLNKALWRTRELTALVKRGLVDTTMNYDHPGNNYFAVYLTPAGDEYMHEGDFPDDYWIRLAQQSTSPDDW